MTAVLAAVPEPERRWVPLLDPARYDRSAALTIGEGEALALLAEHRYRWPAGVADALARLIAPIDDALDVIDSHPEWWGRSSTRSLLLGGTRDHGAAFWGWDRDQWLHTVRGANNNSGRLWPRSRTCSAINEICTTRSVAGSLDCSPVAG